MQIAGTAALVTGAASGLGAATAAALARAGAEVVGVDLAAALEGVEPVEGVRVCAADVTDPDEVGAVIATITGSPLRITVNCAGIGWAGRIRTKRGPHPLEVFTRLVSVNLTGTFNVMRLAADAIARTDPLPDGTRGVIVNTASVAADDGQSGQVAYSASKGGVAAMTLPAARDLGRYGIRVNCVSPGTFDTPMIAEADPGVRSRITDLIPFPARLGRPDDFAALVMSVVEQDYLNGEQIRLDGAVRLPATF